MNAIKNVIEKDGEKFYEWTAKVRVHASWVADGFNLTAERLHNMVSNDIQGGYTHEIEAEIVDAPDARLILGEQGYGPGHRDYKVERKAMDLEPAIYPNIE